ncbi:unnamed protein product, partial [Coccothraustes coccothraustes]
AHVWQFPCAITTKRSNFLAKKAKTRHHPDPHKSYLFITEGRKEGRRGSRSSPSWSLEPEM